MAKKRKRKMTRRAKFTILGIILAVLLILAGTGYKFYTYAMGEVAAMKERGRSLKDELKNVVAKIEENDMAGAEATLENVRTINAGIRTELEKPLWQTAKKVPFAAEKIDAVYVLLDVVDEAADSLITPLFEQLKNNPTDTLKVGDGFNVSVILSYINFAESLEPTLLSMADKLGNTDFSFVDSEGKMTEYQQKLLNVAGQYDQLKADINALKVILGNGNNRFYMFGAQNSSEIRAAGGFLGSVGTIYIYDGVLYVGDFNSVYDVMGTYTPASGNVTWQESYMFGNQLAIAHDAEFNPDFRRVAEIWTSAYEPYNGVYCDGVISMTPVMIQRLLKLTGSEIWLPDGTVLNGDNATRGIEYDIYHKYFNIYSKGEYSDDYSDYLFEETARQAMEQFTSNFHVSKIMDYYTMFKESIADRTLMFWMKDEAEEQIMIDAGMSGVINEGRNNAVAGVYFSTCLGSKMGIFTSIDTAVGEAVKNEDGSTSYPVTVTLTNTITNDELYYDDVYILGPLNGTIASYVHLFAPVGGTISDVYSSDGVYYNMDEYLGVQVAYALNVYLYPNAPVTISYTVTTAPGVEEPLTFSKTPTLQDYRW